MMAGWRDTIKDEKDKAPKSWRDTIQDESESSLPSLETVGETAQDLFTGGAQGFTLGGADELAGAGAAGIETLLGKLGIGPQATDAELAAQGFKMPEESLGDIYRQYQQAGEQASELAKERSPVAEFGGQIGGNLLAASMLGLNAAPVQGPKALLSQISQNKGAGEAALALLRGTATSGSRVADAAARGVGMFGAAAPGLAAEAALTSKNQLIGDEANPMGVAQDVASGLAFGLPAMVGMNVATEIPAIASEKLGEKTAKIKQKVAEAFQSEDNPRLRQMEKAFNEYGQELGIHPRSHAADISGPKFAKRDEIATRHILDVIDHADSSLGKEVGESIERATQRGSLVDISPDINAAAQRVNDLASQIPDLGSTRKSAMAFDKILNGMSQLTPVEVKNLIDDLDAAIGTFKAATNKDAASVGTLNELMKYRKSISDTFKRAVPEYGQAAERFEAFRNVMEQIVSGDRPADITQTFFGNLRNQDQKLYDKVINMIEHVQRPAQSSQSARAAFVNTMDALEKFEADELTRGKSKVLPSVESIRKYLLNASDDSVLRGSVRSTTESRSVVPDLKEAIIGKAPTSGAYLAGKAIKSAKEIAAKPLIKSTAAMTKAVLKAPAQSISNLASKLESSGSFKLIGKALRESLENGDTAKKNAALFTIMQNPNARAFISAEDFPDVEEQE